jgi:hypothetical protein
MPSLKIVMKLCVDTNSSSRNQQFIYFCGCLRRQACQFSAGVKPLESGLKLSKIEQ